MARLSTASLMLHLAVQVLQVDKELQVNNVVMMASWLFELLVTRVVLYALVSFEQCSLLNCWSFRFVNLSLLLQCM